VVRPVVGKTHEGRFEFVTISGAVENLAPIALEEFVPPPIIFTPLQTLDLDPLLARAGAVAGIDQLGDDAFELHAGDPHPERYSFITRVRSGYGPGWTGLQTHSA